MDDSYMKRLIKKIVKLIGKLCSFKISKFTEKRTPYAKHFHVKFASFVHNSYPINVQKTCERLLADYCDANVVDTENHALSFISKSHVIGLIPSGTKPAITCSKLTIKTPERRHCPFHTFF